MSAFWLQPSLIYTCTQTPKLRALKHLRSACTVRYTSCCCSGSLVGVSDVLCAVQHETHRLLKVVDQPLTDSVLASSRQQTTFQASKICENKVTPLDKLVGGILVKANSGSYTLGRLGHAGSSCLIPFVPMQLLPLFQ